jgi:hypothetical protein
MLCALKGDDVVLMKINTRRLLSPPPLNYARDE